MPLSIRMFHDLLHNRQRRLVGAEPEQCEKLLPMGRDDDEQAHERQHF
jgi:hypothetical protein